ncbi:prothoracicostatic peptide [Coccinella septempunctata]|uniref:prothoracicostatic peptide n=1 Tax=Coccinella septempunctata TaxID=41139 RepID=UPI001D08480A|nr:prothoracicostatic peptide [Coccinella septempunctata]
MRYVFASASHKFLGAAVLAFYLQVNFAYTLPEDATILLKSEDDNLQTDTDMVKKNWDKNLKMWGKRAWSNLHGGWGIKRSIPEDSEQDIVIADKRSWENLRSGWGKRNDFMEDVLSQEPMMTRLETDYPDSDNLEYNEDEKRSWSQLNHGWGKRNKWSEFRGAWGKRRPDPAWNNLKGIWGKRNYNDNVMI